MIWQGLLLVTLVALRSPGTSTFVTRSLSRTRLSPTKMAESRRQPRRNLKKRPGRRDKKGSDDFPWDTAETRPVLREEVVEKGEDYWMDDRELAKNQAKDEAIKNRKAMEGEISKEKLREEVVAPYKQNWIGFLSVAVIVLATIITKFPELLQAPIIQIPDL